MYLNVLINTKSVPLYSGGILEIPGPDLLKSQIYLTSEPCFHGKGNTEV